MQQREPWRGVDVRTRRFTNGRNRTKKYEAMQRRLVMLVKNYAPLAALLALGLATAACGNNPTDRALTGGAIGAGTGAVVGSTVGAPVAGAVVGGLGGAAVGAATTPRRDY